MFQVRACFSNRTLLCKFHEIFPLYLWVWLEIPLKRLNFTRGSSQNLYLYTRSRASPPPCYIGSSQLGSLFCRFISNTAPHWELRAQLHLKNQLFRHKQLELIHKEAKHYCCLWKVPEIRVAGGRDVKGRGGEEGHGENEASVERSASSEHVQVGVKLLPHLHLHTNPHPPSPKYNEG